MSGRERSHLAHKDQAGRRSAKRPIAILKIDGLRGARSRSWNSPYPHEVAVTYPDGGVSVAWLVAREEFWTDAGCGCAKRVKQHRADTVLCCKGAAADQGLCPTAAISSILKATSDYDVLSSDALNTSAWLRSLFSAGPAATADPKVSDVVGWAQRRYKRDALQDAGFVSDTGTRPVNRAASAAEKWALFVLSLHGLPKKLATPRRAAVTGSKITGRTGET